MPPPVCDYSIDSWDVTDVHDSFDLECETPYERYCASAERNPDLLFAVSCRDIDGEALCKGCRRQRECKKLHVFCNDEGLIKEKYFTGYRFTGWYSGEFDVSSVASDDDLPTKRVYTSPVLSDSEPFTVDDYVYDFESTHFDGLGNDAHKTNGNIDSAAPVYAEPCIRGVDVDYNHNCNSHCPVRMIRTLNPYSLIQLPRGECLSHYNVLMAHQTMNFFWHFPRLNANVLLILQRIAKRVVTLLFDSGAHNYDENGNLVIERVPCVQNLPFFSKWHQTLFAFTLAHDWVEYNFVTCSGLSSVNFVFNNWNSLPTENIWERFELELTSPEPDEILNFMDIYNRINHNLHQYHAAIQWVEFRANSLNFSNSNSANGINFVGTDRRT
jgi:hypothetical protein